MQQVTLSALSMRIYIRRYKEKKEFCRQTSTLVGDAKPSSVNAETQLRLKIRGVNFQKLILGPCKLNCQNILQSL